MMNSISILVGAALIAIALLLQGEHRKYEAIALGDGWVVRINSQTGSLTPCFVRDRPPDQETRARCGFAVFVGD